MRPWLSIVVSVFLSLGLSFVLYAQSTDRVVLVIIDGARYTETLGDPTGTWTPRMKLLSAAGTVVDTFVNDNITVTIRAIPAIWTGSWATPIDTTIGSQPKTQYAATPSVWEYFRKARGVDSTQAAYVIGNVTSPWLPSYSPGYGPSYWPSYLVGGVTDRDVWDSCRAFMVKHHPVLTVLYLANVDHMGHLGNYANYLRAITIADSIVGEMWEFLQGDATFAGHTTMFITNDHGRHDDAHGGFQNHGDGCWGCRHIMFLGMGPGIRSGVHTSVRRKIPDIVPTIGRLLNFLSPQATGSVMAEVLTTTSVSGGDEVPATFQLDQNYPNPFNPETVVSYQSSVVSWVNLRVFDVLGREVAVLVNGIQPPGDHSVRWNAAGRSAGVYFYRLTAGQSRLSRKLVLLK